MNFDKYQGAGNDFIIINNIDGNIALSSEQIEQMCDRRFGIGADGLIVVNSSNEYDFAMKFYNSDGHTASMCGNGGRCIAKYAFDNHICSNKMTFIADDGIHEAEILDDTTVKLKMIDVDGISKFEDGLWTNTGVPHFVKFVDDIYKIDIVAEGRKLADDKRFAPNRTNVNFVDQNGGFRLATYERGVEGETSACGTGTVASALCINATKGNESPITLQAKGGMLKVFFEKKNSKYTNIWLEGPAKKVFRGETYGE